MRWKEERPPKEDDVRIVKRFLFFPLTLDYETRWLEKAVIIQQYTEVMVSEPHGMEFELQWVDKSWGKPGWDKLSK